MNITIITGSGTSNNLPTLRDNFDVTQLNRKNFIRNSVELSNVLYGFRDLVNNNKPNEFYYYINELQETHNINIITQNVDGYHKQSGNKNVYEIHGNINRDRIIYNWFKKYKLPDIVLYDEPIRYPYTIMQILLQSDITIFIGTSLKTKPVANFVEHLAGKIFWIDPNAHDDRYVCINEDAYIGLKKVFEIYIH